MSEQDKNNDYEPWYYCAVCLSPSIQHEDVMGSDYCKSCGSTSVVESTFEEWEAKYVKKYGHRYTEKSNDIRNSPVFKMSFSKLMKKVSDCPKWDSIIKEIYGHIPRGIGKADAIIVFFDRLVHDNKLDSLRELLYKWKI